MHNNNYLELPAIKVSQPIGVFYAISIPAKVLLDLCYTIRLEVLDDTETTPLGIFNKLKGTQRETKPLRLRQIQDYSETIDATFPNSIILGANYDDETGLLIEDDESRWYIEKEENGFMKLIIPDKKRLASIIDGQHRLYGIEDSLNNDMDLLCSVFLELPMAYHANIFMNINMNQRKVDRNLAYSLFSFEMEPGSIESWSPDTLAVYFARLLGTSDKSILNKKINGPILDNKDNGSISFASVIDGIIALITQNPKNDRHYLHKNIKIMRDRTSLIDQKSNAPLRELYVFKKDKSLYNIILNYVNSFGGSLWKLNEYKIMKNTLGIQAIFDFLKLFLIQDTKTIKEAVKERYEKKGKNYDKKEFINDYTEELNKRYSEDFFYDVLIKAKNIDFDNEYFAVQSKARTRLKNLLLIKCLDKDIDDLKIRNIDEYKSLKSFLNIIK